VTKIIQFFEGAGEKAGFSWRTNPIRLATLALIGAFLAGQHADAARHTGNRLMLAQFSRAMFFIVAATGAGMAMVGVICFTVWAGFRALSWLF